MRLVGRTLLFAMRRSRMIDTAMGLRPVADKSSALRWRLMRDNNHMPRPVDHLPLLLVELFEQPLLR